MSGFFPNRTAIQIKTEMFAKFSISNQQVYGSAHSVAAVDPHWSGIVTYDCGKDHQGTYVENNFYLI